jgi:amino acid transporter
MKSKLNIIEFRNRLKENTKIGRPELQLSLGILSIFFLSSKSFYGNFDDSTFQLTKNYNFTSGFYLLKGKYQNIDNKVKLNYIIEPMSKIGIIWLKYFPFVAMIGFNSFFFFNIKNAINEVYIVFNLFIVFIIFYSRWDIKRKKKNLEQKFIEIFEIENIDK